MIQLEPLCWTSHSCHPRWGRLTQFVRPPSGFCVAIGTAGSQLRRCFQVLLLKQRAFGCSKSVQGLLRRYPLNCEDQRFNRKKLATIKRIRLKNQFFAAFVVGGLVAIFVLLVVAMKIVIDNTKYAVLSCFRIAHRESVFWLNFK